MLKFQNKGCDVVKFSGKIGFWETDEETNPGVYKPVIVERPYTGNITRNYRKFQSAENQQNDNLRVNNQVSIISDLYIRNNWASIAYILWNGVKWKVNTVEVAYPRLVLEIGEVWNGEETIA